MEVDSPVVQVSVEGGGVGKNVGKVLNIGHVPGANVDVEGGSVPDVPVLNIGVEMRRFPEHPVHFGHFAGVPVVDVAVEEAQGEHLGHVQHVADIPVVQFVVVGRV